jgi:hypothetical protein
MLNCYCQLSSSVIFRQYGVSQSECKIDRPRPGLPRVSPRPHTEALGTRLTRNMFDMLGLPIHTGRAQINMVQVPVLSVPYQKLSIVCRALVVF